MNRKGLGKGLGTGYKNIAPMDSHIHSLSAKGCKSKLPTAVKKVFNLKAKSSMSMFRLTNGDDIVCYSESTRTGFRHIATLMRNGREIAKDKAVYYNRTWESYEYESVINKLVRGYYEPKEADQLLSDLNKSKNY